MSKVFEQLAELMAEDELNQTALANALNISQSKISTYLADKSLPNYSVFVALVEYFNCSADFLLGLTDFPERDKNYKPTQPFNTRLPVVLKEKGFSQYAFIKKSGLSWSVLHGWLTGKTLPSADNILKICRTVDCSADYLLGRQ